MFRIRSRIATVALSASLALAVFSTAVPVIDAADHAESTSVAGDPGADLADVFVFLDPNDNSRVVLALDVEGFIVPSELLNLSFFAPEVLYRFEIENTGDGVGALSEVDRRTLTPERWAAAIHANHKGEFR